MSQERSQMSMATDLSQIGTAVHRGESVPGKRVAHGSVRRVFDGIGALTNEVSHELSLPRERYSTVVMLSVFLLAAFDTALFVFDRAAHFRLTVEDGFVENLTFVFWFIGGIYILGTLHRRDGRWFVAAVALAMLWVAGEEISWGQRLFAIPTPPALAAINEQHELNIHNIRGIQEHIKMVGLPLIFVYCLVLPALYRFWPAARGRIIASRISLFGLDAVLMIVLAMALMVGPRVLGMSAILDEVSEMTFGSAFFLFAFDRRWLSASSRR
jgi:hypothetical protein